MDEMIDKAKKNSEQKNEEEKDEIDLTTETEEKSLDTPDAECNASPPASQQLIDWIIYIFFFIFLLRVFLPSKVWIKKTNLKC